MLRSEVRLVGFEDGAMSERVFERANQHHGAFSSVVHRPSPLTIDHVAMVHQ